MDFMKLLRSFEELLYEVMVMLVFYPKTLWLTFRYPQRMMDYADTELGDVENEQYNDTLSPPLFLLICLVIAYVADRAVPSATNTAAIPAYLQSTENLLAFRVFVFSLFPLAMSLRLLFGLKLRVDRETLRAPFYAQCFVAAPVAMLFSFSQSFRHVAIPHSGWIADVLLAAAVLWYLRQQAHWFRAKLHVSLARGWSIAVGMAILTIMVALAITLIMLLGSA